VNKHLTALKNDGLLYQDLVGGRYEVTKGGRIELGVEEPRRQNEPEQDDEDLFGE
jgi:hypothetical protein